MQGDRSAGGHRGGSPKPIEELRLALEWMRVVDGFPGERHLAERTWGCLA